ncbi:unnamed protein product [Rotaria magnacalcarata]|uniref:Uncharacterized protein n=2 Tax=Rotaria magnacalcarata TaxID=392030 RepID=A0A816AVJ0_9BILA|nr:unnamed protein product [Rotaria magnacalcarata]CAF1682239.1 unnamed protein product [Rotaria magnacalcarata]CAF3938649.1 unnamed protein product [Rotaria magnacalcarata]CAF3966708.1 unnamed protein product [Rotaria magnacalcarata]
MKLSDATILTTATFITSIGALLTLIGLTTPRWLKNGYGLWNCRNVCSPSAATLTVLALIFLVISIVLLIVILVRLLPDKLRLIPLGLLVTATLFLIIATARYLRRFGIIDYSFELITTAHAFAFVASVLLAFWLGTKMNENSIRNTTRSTIPSSTIVFPSS